MGSSLNNEFYGHFCPVEEYIYIFGQCISKDGYILVVILTIALIFYTIFKSIQSKRKDIEPEFLSNQYSFTSYKPLEKGDLKQITVHELGHALVAMNFKSLFQDLSLQIFDKDLESLRQGYIFYQINSEIDDKSPKILEVKMLILLGGMQAEKHYFDGNCLVHGCKSDLDHWFKLARTYLRHKDDDIFYNDPENSFEQQHNTQLLLDLKKYQIRVLSEFFNANGAVLSKLIDSTMDKKRLSFTELKECTKDIVQTSIMPHES